MDFDVVFWLMNMRRWDSQHGAPIEHDRGPLHNPSASFFVDRDATDSGAAPLDEEL